jgi:hypothetical protein
VPGINNRGEKNKRLQKGLEGQQFPRRQEKAGEVGLAQALTSAARSSVPSVSSPQRAWQRGGVGGNPSCSGARARGFSGGGAKPTNSFEASVAGRDGGGGDDDEPGGFGGGWGGGCNDARPKPQRQTRPSPALAVNRAGGLASSWSAETGPIACAVQLST